jgi:hypothetical protein
MPAIDGAAAGVEGGGSGTETGTFDIRFIRDEVESLAEFLGEGAWGLRGRITLGEYTEEFVALLRTWTRADYERHWVQAARRMADGADRTAFFTSAYEFRWTLWRVGERVVAQEHFLTAEHFPEPFDPDDLYTHIQDRRTRTDDGAAISEWTLDLAGVAAFAARAPHPPSG